jgi:hypothetical protein
MDRESDRASSPSRMGNSVDDVKTGDVDDNGQRAIDGTEHLTCTAGKTGMSQVLRHGDRPEALLLIW